LHRSQNLNGDALLDSSRSIEGKPHNQQSFEERTIPDSRSDVRTQPKSSVTLTPASTPTSRRARCNLPSKSGPVTSQALPISCQCSKHSAAALGQTESCICSLFPTKLKRECRLRGKWW
ncbi:hypothetical protein CMEL01_11830, partial [Colletotrichum melonis]